MIYEINNRQAGIDDDEYREAQKLLRFSLSRFAGVITRVTVRFSDVNGPRGGIDKRCRVTAKMRTTGQVTVTGDGKNYLESLGNCLERLVRATRRQLEKRGHSPVCLKQKSDQPPPDQNAPPMP